MKPADFKFKNKPTSRLVLLLCAVGVVLVAWWAWAAGPIHPKSAIKTGQTNQGQTKLTTPSYQPLNSVSPSSGTSSTPASESSSTANLATPPDSSQSVYPSCRPLSGIQPYIARPCNCGGFYATSVCCAGTSGVETMCPEPTY